MAKARSLAVFGAACSWLEILSGCGQDTEALRSERAALVAVCADTIDSVPQGAWLCGTARTIECDAHPGTASPATIYATPKDGCSDRTLFVDEGPFAMGEREIVVSEDFDAVGAGTPTSIEVCRSLLTVVDTRPPSAAPSRTELWPPNHEMHTVSAQQCAGVRDVCDPNPSVRFTSATSDEPVDAEGDGSHEPDISFESPEVVALRAERQGGKNGRVYSLSWQATDASGNASDGTCSVLVPHDASGRPALPDPPAYRVMAPGLP